MAWIDSVEIAPGIPVVGFDPAGMSFDELTAAASTVKALEREYTVSLMSSTPILKMRLVELQDAIEMCEGGSVILRGSLAGVRGYLPCTGAEAEPVLVLREASLRILESVVYQDGILGQMRGRQPDVAIQRIVMRDDGYGFDVFDGRGEWSAMHKMSMPGTVSKLDR